MRDTFVAGQRQAAERMYFLTDANYNATGVVRKVNNVWQVAERVLYDAYGRARFCLPDWDTNFGPDGLEGTPDDGTVSLFGNTTLFTGREWDAETGLLFYRARYYSADLGPLPGKRSVGNCGRDQSLRLRERESLDPH